MSELDAKSEQLKRQADLMALTLESVFNDAQAKEVISGRITDAYLVKIKLDIDNKNGIIFILVSSIRKEILEIYVVIGSSPIFQRIRIFADYIQMSTDLVDIAKGGCIDNALSETVGKILHLLFTKEKLEEFLPKWEKKDPSRLAELIEPAIMSGVNGVKAGKVKIQGDVDKLSSAKFRTDNPLKGHISSIPKPEIPIPALVVATTKSVTGEVTALDRQMLALRQGFTKEATMKTMIAPISGLDFDSLVAGQEILFRIPTDTAEGVSVAGVFGLIDEEGKVSKEPIVGKFRGIASAKNEYHIFAEGPNEYLFHSMEENPVRVAVPKPIPNPVATPNEKQPGNKTKQQVTEVQKNKGNIYSIIGIIVAVTLVAALIFALTAF